MMKSRTIKFLTLGLLALVISACGGGGGESPLITPPITFNQPRGFSGGVLTLVPATDASGDIYVGGVFSSNTVPAGSSIIRLNSNGTADSGFSFGTGFSGIPGLVNTLATATDGSGDLYVGGGFNSYNGTVANKIIRLNSNGTVDSGFNIGIGFDDIEVKTMAQATDGSGDIYVGGQFNSYNGTGARNIIRLNSNGTVDSGFNIGTGFGGTVKTLLPATDGSGDIYVGGQFNSYNGTGANGIIRLNSNGTIDSGFAIGTGFEGFFVEFGTVLAPVNTLVQATDGSGDIYVGGTFVSYNGTEANNIIRLNSNGTIDSGFAIGTGFDVAVNALVQATDGSGDIYVGGTFTGYNGTGANGIIRLNSNGTIDSGFAIGTGLTGLISSATVTTLVAATDSSGDIYVGGAFTNYNGIRVGSIARLSSAGAVR